ncbi:MAG TPA: phosphatidate cytidylyltransferase [Hanamia sp.]|nr:phosphatidate cytidylyltransferase [Hanamia sp.]
MKKISLSSMLALLIFMSVTFTSCEAIAGIFKAGMWVGILIVVIIVGIILWIIGKARK